MRPAGNGLWVSALSVLPKGTFITSYNVCYVALSGRAVHFVILAAWERATTVAGFGASAEPAAAGPMVAKPPSTRQDRHLEPARSGGGCRRSDKRPFYRSMNQLRKPVLRRAG